MDQALIYQSLAKDYDGLSNQVFYRYFMEKLVAIASAAPAGCALDLACGTGISTEVLVRNFPKLKWSAIDVSQNMLDRASAKSTLSDVNFFSGSAEMLPFTDQSFDAVFCSFGLHWFDSRAVDEIRRVLKPGGKAHLVVPLRSRNVGSSGNDALFRWLLSRRTELGRLKSQGFERAELEALFSGWSRFSFKESRLTERFKSTSELFATLKSRGSLNAILNNPFLSEFELPLSKSELNFEWSVGLLSVYP